jgi:hypothetical protein
MCVSTIKAIAAFELLQQHAHLFLKYTLKGGKIQFFMGCFNKKYVIILWQEALFPPNIPNPLGTVFTASDDLSWATVGLSLIDDKKLIGFDPNGI